MALDGILLHKILPGIQEVLPARIQKIYQISSNEILFQLHGNKSKHQLLISCHSQYNRMLITKRNYPTPSEPGNFVMVLRKYLEGGIIVDLKQQDLDRWCVYSINRHNDIGDKETLYLYVELMGKYANIILVNQNNNVIDALKRIPPYENNRRIIHPGAEFKETPSQNKKNPFLEYTIDETQSLTQQFAGFSPFLASEIEYRMHNGENFKDIMSEIESSDNLYIANNNDEAIFHCLELKSIGKCVKYPFFDGFDILYYHKEEKERIKEISGDIYKVVKRELKHQKTKLPRLLKELDEAQDCDKYRKYGDLLYSYNIFNTKGHSSIDLQDFETEETITIPLDPKLDGNQNAKKFYTRYKKLKVGQKYLQEQIDICNTEIEYFTGLLEQLDQADFKTAEEIRDELIKEGYIKENNKKKKNKKKHEHITTFHSITLDNGITISFGKNNLQNEDLTFHNARKEHIWLHAKDYHGAHVVIHDSNPDESTLRLAANIAAYFSKGRSSSSVPVNYCPVKELKKIPGAKPGMVQLGSYKTIYIDPDEDELINNGVEII